MGFAWLILVSTKSDGWWVDVEIGVGLDKWLSKWVIQRVSKPLC